MESIRGKQTCRIDAATLAARIARYPEIVIDIGTGDGRYVRQLAQRCPASLAIGIDACRENLRATSRTAPPNALFIIANALALPPELTREPGGLATRITINFPWGSLLGGLVHGDPRLLGGLGALARPGAMLEIRLNQGAPAEAGYALAAGVRDIQEAVRAAGFAVTRSTALDAAALRACPTTWARRLAHGRDPSGWYLAATLHTVRRRQS